MAAMLVWPDDHHQPPPCVGQMALCATLLDVRVCGRDKNQAF